MVARRMFDFPSTGWRNPMAEMEQMARQMDWLASRILNRPGVSLLSANVFPAVNITEDKGKYYVRAELPGIKSDEISMEVTGKNLAITGERKIDPEGEKVKYHRKERDAGRFSRVIGLPGDVDADSVEAKLVNGILTVAIAKSEAAKPKQISVQAS